MNDTNENIENNESKKIAPTLFSLKKVNNLKPPHGYFDSLANSVLKIVDEKNAASSLSHLKKENKLNVPEGYFENLSDRIMTKIETQEARVIPFKKKKLIRYISAAASIAAVFALAILLNKKPSTDIQLTKNETPFEELTVEEFTNEIFLSDTENLICYVDFEDENSNDSDIYYELNETNLDITSDEIDEYLSSDYYLDVEF